MTLIHVNKLSKKNTERTVMKNKIADLRPCFEEKTFTKARMEIWR